MKPSLSKYGQVAVVLQDDCVECGECRKSGVCPVEAHYMPQLEWPRVLRYMWSDPVAVFPKTGIAGRGTQEMKTNDVSGRFMDGEVGIAVEFGRPGVGARLGDAEKASTRLAKLGVVFESESPWTDIIDLATGALKDPSVRNEKVLSCIVECKAPAEKTQVIYKALMEVAGETETVFTLDIISKCRKGVNPLKPTLDKAGIKVRENGKTNVGLGRPLIP